ncbi:MAG: efflux RND transporter periplasmic adaptor subunit [Opitutae bacterium]|nr:efflux RND transporter periplasmic adaptor subunit [Opitutae bacterium]
MRLSLAALVLLLAACGRPPPPPLGGAGPVLPVRAAVVVAELLPVVLEVPASVRPAERASLAAKLAGTVASFPLGLGSAVAAGDVLVTLHAPETEARLRQSQAQLAEAERTAVRQRTLVATGVNPVEALRDAEDRLRFAQAAVTEAEALLAYATVRAPFAGVITEKHVLPGDLATPGRPLLALESTQRLRAEGAVPEHAAASLKIGRPVGVVLDENAIPLLGDLEEISGAADAVSRSILVKVALPPGAARSGQFARLRVASGETAALLAPGAALTRFGQMERVFVVEAGHAVLRLVKTGRVIDERVEILSGLNAGETVILAPPAALRDGQPVAIQP